MKYLKKFNQHTDYETFMDSRDLIYPNVSYCVDRSEVHFNPDPYNGHKFVDLGLPSGTLWATTNIGANSPEEYGLYFAWGETIGYTASQVGTDKQFSWADYKFNPSGDGTTMTKYNSTDNKTKLKLEDDAAYVNWGEKWCMPTEEQFQELINKNNCTSGMATINGVDGVMFTSVVNGNTLFFPFMGSSYDGELEDLGEFGEYGSNSLNDISDVTKSISLMFFNERHIMTATIDTPRYAGLPIRPVIYVKKEIVA